MSRTLTRLLALAALALAALTLLATASGALGSATGETVVDLPLWGAIVLGLVEGFTEYLPVSSTGHLLVVTELLGLADSPAAKDALDTYAICIQVGAIAAVLLLYRERVWQMVDGLLGRSAEGRRVLLGVIAAFIPTAIIGYALKDLVRDNLFGVGPVAVAWLIGGIGILALTRSGIMQRPGLALGDITVRHALIIGLAQSIALWPGVSRSLVTIVAGVLVGLSLAAAVEFSFLLGLITLTAATVLTAITDGSQLVELFGWFNPLVGLIVGFIAAVASIKWMVTWLQDRGLNVFGYYRVAIGVLAFAAIGAGALTP